MLGLALGAWAVEKRKPVNSAHALSVLALITGFAALVYWSFSFASAMIPSFVVAINCGFFMVVFGGLVGAAFPLTVQVLTNFGIETNKATGLSYSYDLLGGAIGAFLLGALLLPLWGTSNLLLLCSALCLLTGFICWLQFK
jgi:predicted membrane-bound spermidine synthase